jgi:tetratricopeptide (TPR) repeat protein
MMHHISIFIFTISLIFLFSACVSKQSPAKAPDTPQANKVPEAYPLNAVELEKQQKYTEALKQYNLLIGTAENRNDLYAAMRGKARCLRAMGRLKLALGSLAPLPVKPKTSLDCLQLAMAGELFLQMHKYKEAESSLEVALDGVRGKEKKYRAWSATASANLGNAYLRNGKLEQSRIMYKKAAELYHYSNRPGLEKKCLRTILALGQIQVEE